LGFSLKRGQKDPARCKAVKGRGQRKSKKITKPYSTVEKKKERKKAAQTQKAQRQDGDIKKTPCINTRKTRAHSPNFIITTKIRDDESKVANRNKKIY